MKKVTICLVLFFSGLSVFANTKGLKGSAGDKSKGSITNQKASNGTIPQDNLLGSWQLIHATPDCNALTVEQIEGFRKSGGNSNEISREILTIDNQKKIDAEYYYIFKETPHPGELFYLYEYKIFALDRTSPACEGAKFYDPTTKANCWFKIYHKGDLTNRLDLFETWLSEETFKKIPNFAFAQDLGILNFYDSTGNQPKSVLAGGYQMSKMSIYKDILIISFMLNYNFKPGIHPPQCKNKPMVYYFIQNNLS